MTAKSCIHYSDVIMGAMGSQITGLAIVYSTVYSDADQRKHQSSASLPFVWGIHRGPVNCPHKWSVTRKMFPFHDVIMSFPFRVGLQLANTWPKASRTCEKRSTACLRARISGRQLSRFSDKSLVDVFFENKNFHNYCAEFVDMFMLHTVTHPKEMIPKSCQADELATHPYDRSTVTITHGWLTNSSVWRNHCCCLVLDALTKDWY